jgi:hypothetical protein
VTERQALDERNLSSASAWCRHHGMTERGDLQVIGIAAKARGVGLQLGIGLPGGLEIGVAREDELAPARGEAASAAALPGLNDHRVALL